MNLVFDICKFKLKILNYFFGKQTKNIKPKRNTAVIKRVLTCCKNTAKNPALAVLDRLVLRIPLRQYRHASVPVAWFSVVAIATVPTPLEHSVVVVTVHL